MSSNADETTAALRRSARAARRAGLSAEKWGFFIDAGYYPLPWAMQFHADAERAFLDRRDLDGRIVEDIEPNLFMLGSTRNTGKSHAAFMEMVWRCHFSDGVTWWFLRKVGKSAKEKMTEMIQESLSLIPHDWAESKGVLSLPNGSKIMIGYFKTAADIQVVQGQEYAGMFWDETPNLEKDLVQDALGQVRTRKGSGIRVIILFTGNPGGVGNQWVVDSFAEPHRNGRFGRFLGYRTRFFHTTAEDNPLISVDYMRYMRGLTGVLRKLWYLGDWFAGAGIYFANFSEARHVIRPFPIPAHWKMWGGLDYGFSHPTVVHLMAKNPDTGALYFVAEHFLAGALPEEHAPLIKALAEGRYVQRRLSQLPPLAAGHDVFAKGKDPKGGTIDKAYNKLGIRLKKANIARVTGWAKMSRMLGSEGDDNGRIEIEPTLFFFDTCPHLIEQMQKMISDPNHLEDVKKVNANAEGKGGDDAADTGRYTVMEDVEKIKTAVVPSVIMRAGYR